MHRKSVTWNPDIQLNFELVRKITNFMYRSESESVKHDTVSFMQEIIVHLTELFTICKNRQH